MADLEHGSEIKIPAYDGGVFNAYVAVPEGISKDTPAPAIIMIQEIFGVNQEMRDKCNEMAKQGYIAICPDLFWRIEPGIQLVDSDEEQLARAFELYQTFDIEQGMEDLKTTLGYLRNHDKCVGKVGCIGYCLGGYLAVGVSVKTDIDASVSYYGVNLPSFAEHQDQIDHPLMLHIAEKDEFVSPEDQTAIKDGLGQNPNVTIHSYEGQDHAFARGNGMHYNEDAATLANARTAEFLASHLKA